MIRVRELTRRSEVPIPSLLLVFGQSTYTDHHHVRQAIDLVHAAAPVSRLVTDRRTGGVSGLARAWALDQNIPIQQTARLALRLGKLPPGLTRALQMPGHRGTSETGRALRWHGVHVQRVLRPTAAPAAFGSFTCDRCGGRPVVWWDGYAWVGACHRCGVRIYGREQLLSLWCPAPARPVRSPPAERAYTVATPGTCANPFCKSLPRPGAKYCLPACHRRVARARHRLKTGRLGPNSKWAAVLQGDA